MSDFALRLILLSVGLVAILGIYLWDVYKRRERDRYGGGAEYFDLNDDAFSDYELADDPLEQMDRLRDSRAAENIFSYVDDPRPAFEEPPPPRPSDSPASDERDETASLPPSFDIDALDGQSDPPLPEAPPAGPIDSVPAADLSALPSQIEGGDVVGDDASDTELEGLSGLRAERTGSEQLDLEGLEVVVNEDPSIRGAPASEQSAKRSANDDPLVVVIMVLARSGETLAGHDVRNAFEELGMSYGERQIFHRYAPGQPLSAPPMFSAVNAVAPGTFDLDAMDGSRTPGVALFIELPGPPDGLEAFERMLDTGGRLARRLGGHLCDQSRSTLTRQSINHMQEQIAEHRRRQLLKT